MDWDRVGKVHGLVALYSGIRSGPPCAEGCVIETVDIATRLVETQISVNFDRDVGVVVATRHDPVSRALILGYDLDRFASTDPYPGHRVQLIPYQ